MTVEIISSRKKIFASGNFTTFDEKPHIILIKRGDEKVSFELHFLNNPDKPRTFDIESKGTDKDFVLVLKIYNFNNQLGQGTTNPIHIANFDNHDKIYLDLWVEQLIDTLRKRVLYTIYIEEKE